MWRDRGVRVGAVIAVALAAAFLVWLLVIRSDDESSTGPVKAGAGPALGSEADLATLAGKLHHPVFWAGDQPDTRLEITDTKDGRVYARYLTGDAEVGDPRPGFLTVGTYPFKDAFGALEKAAKESGATVQHGDNGALIVTNKSRPTSVYIAYPDQDLQIEVYDPSPERALSIATSGDVTPVS